jgi:hypothetical protein
MISPKESTSTFNRYFSAGLGPQGRIASWIVAFVGAVRHQYMFTFINAVRSSINTKPSSSFFNSIYMYII